MLAGRGLLDYEADLPLTAVECALWKAAAPAFLAARTVPDAAAAGGAARLPAFSQGRRE